VDIRGGEPADVGKQVLLSMMREVTCFAVMSHPLPRE